MGSPPYHDQAEHYAELASIFAFEGGVDLRLTRNLEVLNKKELARYDAVACWSLIAKPNKEQVSALLDAISGGMGFLGIHGATASTWDVSEYVEMIGSKFLRHPPIKPFSVRIDDPDHPITAGISSFEVEDELYELEGDLSRVHILASSEGHPLLYVKTHGKGRVHYNALGHDHRSLQCPQVRRLYLQGLAWVARVYG